MVTCPPGGGSQEGACMTQYFVFAASAIAKDSFTHSNGSEAFHCSSIAGVIASASSAAKERKILAVPGSDSATWLKQEGLQLIMDRMGESRERAMARLSNWSGQVEDCAVLMGILRGAENRTGPAFHMEVADQIRRLAH